MCDIRCYTGELTKELYEVLDGKSDVFYQVLYGKTVVVYDMLYGVTEPLYEVRLAICFAR